MAPPLPKHLLCLSTALLLTASPRILLVSLLQRRLFAVGGLDNIRRRSARKHIGAQTLIRHGLFAHIRNPLYVGNLLIVTGLVVIANGRWWYLLVLPGFIGMCWAIVFAEEEFLQRQFGQEYTAYVQIVNRFVPTAPGLCQSLGTSRFFWGRTLRKETGVLSTWLFAVIVLLVWEQWTQDGVAAWTLGFCNSSSYCSSSSLPIEACFGCAGGERNVHK